MRGHNYTYDEIRYLKENYSNTPTVEIAEKLGRSPAAIRFRASKMGLSKAREIKAQNCMQYALRDRTVHPIGAIVEKTCGGRKYLHVKTDCGWKNLAHYIWEFENGPIPAGANLVFKDGNYLNCWLHNLELITREELLRRNSIHNYPEDLKQAIFTVGLLKRTIEHGK